MATLKKKHKRFSFLKVLLGVLFFGCSFLFLFSFPLWNLSEVVVSGTSLLLPEDVAGLANLPLGENIFLLRFSGAVKELKNLPQVKKVKMLRRLPGTVLIQIEEREPFAVALVGEQSLVIDREGVLLNSPLAKAEVILPDISSLPVVTGLKKEWIKDKFYLDETYAAVIRQTFESLFKIMGSRKLKLEMGRLDDINLLIEDVLKVKLGRPEDLEQKIANFKALLAVMGKDFNRVEYVDLRYPKNPAIKFRS